MLNKWILSFMNSRLQSELDKQLQGRQFTQANYKELPYLRASIDELQRIVNVLPWNIPHSISQEVQKTLKVVN